MELMDDLKFIDTGFIKNLNDLASNKIEYWDLRCEASIGTNIDFTDQKSKEISSYEVYDCGIRTFINGGWGFLVLKELSAESILKNFEKVIKLARLSESLTESKFKIKERDPYIKDFKIEGQKAFTNIDIEEKINLVKQHEKISSEYSKKIKNTRTLYYDGVADSIYLNSFGSIIKQKLALARMFSVSYAQQNGIIQQGRNSIGGLGGFEIMETENALKISKKSAKEAVQLLDASSPKGGQFTVIMDPKLCGTYIHEAFGHACEADHILNKESILEGKIGEQVANDQVTIIDNPTIGLGKQFGLPYEFFGSYFIDDEGIPAQKSIIVEDGMFKNFLHSLETASRLECEPNGHGRAASPSSKPQVRMGITILETGDWTAEEIISDTKKGVYCEDFQYGYTDPTTGNVQFKTRLSYKIEKGEKTELMRDVSLSGMTLEVLNRISAIGNEIGFSDGMCGKGGQSVRVCDGGPYIRVDNIMIGGLN
ncbi:MAG: TldD/PmbA family protein [Promethearchaeota archaeon]|nr:MAG: TldD/PmbA family protein [Candidatus Lokiarchaeota archaeon]